MRARVRSDFVEFMNHARAVGMRVIVDLVVSHTSDAHPWFQSNAF